MINRPAKTGHDDSREPEAGSVDALLLGMVGSGKRVLQLGCSSRRMSRWLSQRGCKVTTIESDASLAADAEKYSGEAIVADLDTRSLADLLPRTTFDVALLANILANVRDPWKLLDETRSLLGSSSMAIFSVPNIAHGAARLSLLRGAFDYSGDGPFGAAHLRFFTLRTTRELCLRAGYRMGDIQRTKTALFSDSILLPNVDPSEFGEGIISEIERDPEHDTVDFVVQAIPLADDQKFTVAIADLIKTEERLRLSSEEGSAMALEIAALRATIADLSQTAESALAAARKSNAEKSRLLLAAQVEYDLLRRELEAIGDRPARETTVAERPDESLGSNGSTPADDVTDSIRDLEIDRLNLVEHVRLVESRLSHLTHDAWWGRNKTRSTHVPPLRELAKLLPKRPTISILVATYETPEHFLRQAIDSVRDQIYPYWQLCIADDASKSPHVRSILQEYARLDSRIQFVVRDVNGHISQATNSALELAHGEFVGFLDHDDLLTRDALLEVAVAINRTSDVDVIYSDEDKIDKDGLHCEPHFKPDWCPESYLSRNYTCHFGVYRRKLVESIGGLRVGFEGSQDYDLVLRLTDITDRVVHIPKILYHWRMHSGSTAAITEGKPYAFDAAIRALNEAIVRRGEEGHVEQSSEIAGVYIPRYRIADPRRVTVVVTTAQGGAEVDRCLNSVLENTEYPDLEVLVVHSPSTETETLDVLREWKHHDERVRVLRYDESSNVRRARNFAASEATGDYLAFVDDRVEILSAGWIEAMVEHAQRPAVAAVGALILYPDDTVQHAGIVVGLHGVAGYAFRGQAAQSPGYRSMAKAVVNYSAVSDACMMLRRAAFASVAGFDQELEFAFADVDLCLKLLHRGHRNVYLPHVRARKFEPKPRISDGDPQGIVGCEREVAIMKSRWDTANYLDRCYNPNLSRDHDDFRVFAESEPWAQILEDRKLGLAAAQ